MKRSNHPPNRSAATRRRAFCYCLPGLLAGLATACTPEWSNSESVYVRNQTGQPLHLTLTVARAALQLDTVWWGIDMHSYEYREMGFVQRLTDIRADGLQYPPPMRLPVLVRNSADTLVREIFRERRQDINFPHPWDQEPWLTRQEQPQPDTAEWARGVALDPLPGVPDSVRFTFALAPDSTFLVARRSMRLHHSDPDRIEGEDLYLRPVVQWTNARGTHRQPAPVAAAQNLLRAT
ncbi:hypothetical protein, partial [Hymenobacter agri]